ncbi:hypothetical protein HMI54_003332 [Coelomomyces lativittatus]|nr:hypothetical protein HMI56_000269 [Coelomomyces lativittatus]KAJ1508278.1 hypothetical protein HMI54_003332 [Coelomomyces lativittatus]KAJ1517520.1 hypothetical protein HMI55_006823 [Coelomomyces lativittatus]
MSRRRSRPRDEDENMTPPFNGRKYQRLVYVTCPFPGCEDNEVEDLEVHEQVWHEYACEFCECKFPTFQVLDIHLEESHSSYFWAQVTQGDKKTKEEKSSQVLRSLTYFHCFECPWKGTTNLDRQYHMIQSHHWSLMLYTRMLRQVQFGTHVFF